MVHNYSNITCSDLSIPEFHAHSLFRSGWAQTIASFLIPQPSMAILDLKKHAVSLDDGDQAIVSEIVNSKLLASNRICLLIHGLTGSEASTYMTRLGAKLNRLGYRVFFMNLRGCGPGFGHSRGIYHSGRSNDSRHVIRHLERIFPKAPVTQIGFSLGGNITLKMAGEDGAHPSGNLDSAIAISAPIDLKRSVDKLSLTKNFVFDQFFVQLIRREIKNRMGRYRDLPTVNLPRFLTLKILDDLYTGPQGGFENGIDYYEKSSSVNLIPKIKIPTFILCAVDDPIVEAESYENLSANPHVDVLMTETGGHVSFLHQTVPTSLSKPIWWQDDAIIHWLKFRDKKPSRE